MMGQPSVQKVYPLTPMQEGMLYHSTLDPDSSAYFTQLELRITGNLDLAVLEQSIGQLLRSYDILRTVFVYQKLQRPRQIVFRERQANVHFEDIAHLEPERQQQYIQDYKTTNQTVGFRLDKDLLFRVAVFQLAQHEYQLIWSNHHIVMDGWSLGVLMKKLFQYYAQYRMGQAVAVESEKPYVDYIKWLKNQDQEAARDYWEQRLAGFEESTSLPLLPKASLSESDGYQNEEFSLIWDEDLVASLNHVANRYQVTAPNLFQALWGVLLGRYNNTDDVVFGTVVSGRPAAITGIENMVGLFINTVPVRLRMEHTATFADVFAAIQRNALEAQRYDYVPLYEIQSHSALNYHLINHLLAFENYPLDKHLESGNFEQQLGFSVQVVGGAEQTNYDFNLIAFPGDRWTIKMMYNANVYDKQWIEKVANHLTNLARAVTRDPETAIRTVCYLSQDERDGLLNTFAETEVEYPRTKTIPQLFEEQAQRVPDHIAVAYNDEQITYRELNDQANQLATVLRSKGVGPDKIVAIMAERSVQMVVGMVAILKAGGAYLPIDPDYPADRVQFMLEDSQTRHLLTQESLRDRVNFAGEILDFSLIQADAKDVTPLASVNSPDDLCYIIYTSGTTGKPKGVMITHRNVVRLLVTDHPQFTFSDADTWTMFHSFCFDFSVWEMYGALLYGGKLVVVPKLVAQSPQDFRELLIREKVTVLNQTPTAFSSLAECELMAVDRQLNIRYVVFGGEALKPLMLKAWQAKYPRTKLVNMYGITETTVHVTFKAIGEQEIRTNISNIGVPIPTLNCAIMDKDLNLVPAGIVGELCVSGLGVARGYLHRPELTAERFVDHPYKPGERIYRSGDLARLLPNGEMEYFGRIDQQVKIRGFRIELGEIEYQLLRMEPISEAAVLARMDRQGDQTLCAYFVADEELTVKELRQTLRKDLPDYMVPTHFIQLPAMPRTTNGKLDRKALPEQQSTRPEGGAHQQPRSELEQRLAEIWQDVLGVNEMGIDDDFFALGGHSLKAMMLTSKIHQELEQQVPIRVLFERPNIRELSEYLQAAESDPVSTIEPAGVRPHYPVSSAQRRMYIVSELEGPGTSYNIPAALLLRGVLDRPRLEAAFQSLINRHETLRTSVAIVDETLVQKVHAQVDFHLACTEASEDAVEALIDSFIRPFNLREAPLIRAELIQFGEERHLLLIDMHHIIADGASMGILVRDLTQLYRGESLPRPSLHYKDFAVWQNDPDVQRDRLQKQEAYWLDRFAGEVPELMLPSDFRRWSTPRSFTGARFEFVIGVELTTQIRGLAAETGTTVYMFLLAVFTVLLSKYSEQEDIIVGSPIAGRTHAGVADVPGMFVNTLALRSVPRAEKTFQQFLIEVKETCLQAFAHQDYPFETLVEKLFLNRAVNGPLLFNVMFNWQNTEVPELQLGNLDILPYPCLPVAAKFDLTLQAFERGAEIHLSFDYATDLYSQQTMQRWSEDLLQIVQTVVNHSKIHLKEIETTSPAERQQRFRGGSDTGATGPLEHLAPANEVELQLCRIWQDTLDVEVVGVDDNFFELGGHSLKAITLTARIQKKLQREISLKVLFERPTVRGLVSYLEGTAAASREFGGIVPVKRQPYYLVSPAQKRMYILHQLEGDGVSYNMPFALLMDGELDPVRLHRALQLLVERHESLRTSFIEIDGTPMQKVEHDVELELNVMQATEEEVEERVRAFIHSFDLSTAPLFRAGLIQLAEDRHVFLIDMHHIITDGASVEIFIDEIARLYQGEDLPQRTLHYKDYSVWLNEHVQQEKIRMQERYWLEQFHGDLATLNLPTDLPRPPVQSFAGDRIRFHATKETALQVSQLAAQTGTTFHILMLAVFSIFLSKMSGQEEIVIGTPASGRMTHDVMDIPGMFVNTLALRTAPKADKSFLQFLSEAKETSLQALEHQDFPFEELIGKLDLPREMSRNPLFNVMLTVENTDQHSFRLDRLDIRPYDMPSRVAKFDLTLGAFEHNDGIGLQLEYATDLFKRETIVRWGESLVEMLQAIALNPEVWLSDIELLTGAEKHRVLVEWNHTEMEVPTDTTVHQLFEAQVRKTPLRTAVTFNGSTWTYHELNLRANRLANALIAMGIGADDRVGMMVKPSLEMASGVLAILKAGAAFVPIDPSYPAPRVKYILGDSGAQVLLTQTGISVPEEFTGEVVLLNGEQPVVRGEPDAQRDTNPQTVTEAHHLAYVVYTSGTTGQPKGVMVEHNSLVNLCYWHNEAFGVTEQDRSAKYAGIGFDASVWEMFPYWLAGANLHIIDESIRLDILQVNEYFESNGITIAFMPTQLCEQFMELDNRSLRLLLTGGDKLKRTAKCRYSLVNNYGPTEGTVVATSAIIGPTAGTPSIGTPISNTRVYILGAGNHPLPVGVAGELCIAGRCLARGYLNRPNETAEKFVADPFTPGERMYRTGDMVRWLGDGSIEYIGRRDQQVMVRGFRIELSEIEIQLAEHPLVQAAAVTDLLDANGNTELCAYVVMTEELDAKRLRVDLAHVLPAYMVPKFWVQVDALPLTQNGKVDRRALPKPDISVRTDTYKAPETDQEAMMVAIWQQVLGTGQLGVSDNFFSLGGDSIKAIQLASRLHQQGWKLEMKDLFQHPTVEQVSPFLRAIDGKPADQGPVEGDVPLTAIQRWFFEQRFTDLHHWNQSVMLHAPRGFNPQWVEQTLHKMVEQHDALRMVYAPADGQFAQHNRSLVEDAFRFEVVDFRGISDVGSKLTAHANQVQSSINIHQGPLVKLVQYQTPTGDHLLIVIHHLVVDGVSWRIWLEDFASGYMQAAQGQLIRLPEKTNSFQDWATAIQTYANSEALLNQEAFWREIDAEKIIPLPKDNWSTEAGMKNCTAYSMELSTAETHSLLTNVHQAYGTEMNDILLTALGLTIQEWTNEHDVCVNMEGHGREDILPGVDVSRTVGWFTAQYPVVLHIDPADELAMTIKTVKEHLRGIPNKGVGYGILRYLTDDAHQSGGRFSLNPEISFNYLGQFDNEIETEFFSPSDYDMGFQVSPESAFFYTLSFTGIVRNGRLTLSCSYNQEHYLSETISHLMNRYKLHLVKLIDHCTSKEDRDFTPSDFTASDLQLDELGEIFELLTDKLGEERRV